MATKKRILEGLTTQTQPITPGRLGELLPIGTKVRHKKAGLTGKIVAYEFHESGKVSPLPYRVYWDNPYEAYKLIGFFASYPSLEEIEEAP